MIRSDGFYDYAWLPVEGCLNDCWYCYGKTDFKRRGKSYEPKFYPERLKEPILMKKPAMIFITHYTDLMGEFIPAEWIEQVMNIMNQCSWHTFMILSKNPRRYFEFDYPGNCMTGVTVESSDQWQRAEIINKLNTRKWISIEPIMGDFTGRDFAQFELVVIGKLFNHVSKIRPEWVRSVKHDNIYYKPSVRRYL